MKWAKVAWKSSTYDVTHKKSAHPTQKNFPNASYKTCHVFWAFNRVNSTYQTGEIPLQSHVRFGVFFSKIPERSRRPKYYLGQCFPTFFSSRPTFNASFIVRPTIRYMTKINSYVRPASLLLFTWNQQTTNLPIVIVAYLHFPTSRGVRTEIVNATQHI